MAATERVQTMSMWQVLAVRGTEDALVEHPFEMGGRLRGMAGGMSRGGGTPLKDRTRRGGSATDRTPEAGCDEAGGRHCWVVDSPGHPGRWPGVLLEWRRAEQGWDGLVAYVIPEPHGQGVRLVERWVGADHLERVE